MSPIANHVPPIILKGSIEFIGDFVGVVGSNENFHALHRLAVPLQFFELESKLTSMTKQSNNQTIIKG